MFWSNPRSLKWINLSKDARYEPGSYCITQEIWPGPGDLFWPSPLTADGHLHSTSIGIDAGDPNFIFDDNIVFDIDHEQRGIDIEQLGIDIGSDEFIDGDNDMLPDWWEKLYFGQEGIDDTLADTDKDGLSNLQEYELYSSHPNQPALYVDGTSMNQDANGSPALPFSTIQEALDKAESGDSILVLSLIHI